MERQSLLSAVLLLAFLVFALARPLGAQSLYWENPLRLSRGAGSYPQAALAGPVGSQRVAAIWQEYESGQEVNRAWLSLASYGRDGQTMRSRFAGPFSFSGSIPVLFSIAVDRNGRLAIALASEPGKTQVLYSDDGGLSFSESVSVPLAENAVSPRIFPRAAGGWYIFVTVGSDFDFALSYTWTADGTNWQPLQLFVPPESGLRQSVLPSAAALNGRDYVLFQSLSGGGVRPTDQLYSMVSADGGLSWSVPQRVTDFNEPVRRDQPDPDAYSNQWVHLRQVGNELWYSWQRQPTGGGRWQVYLARLDESGRTMAGTASRVTLDQGNASEPRLFSIEGNIAVSWFDDRRGSPRVYMSVRDGLLWRETDLSGRAGGSGILGRAVYLDGGLYAFWQNGELATASIIGLIPDTTVQAPRLTPVDFRDGVRIRRDRASVRWTMPADSSGIQGYSWLWTRDADEEPPEDIMLLQDETALSRTADDDGEWYFAIRARDYAGNWSATERVAFVRDTTPPGLPLPLPPQTGPDNFLSANTFSLRWQAPDDPDVAGYAWRLDLLGPLDRLPARKRPAETAVQLSAADRQAASTSSPEAASASEAG
ncbi:MAG: glycoside hydrolase, partial [Spirochaetes bacterium]|nr:glycoside hydrolase [Spirochaetota bacterium]MBU0956985.1 glycoside hydrolase [Spirochaetota bacterium]